MIPLTSCFFFSMIQRNRLSPIRALRSSYGSFSPQETFLSVRDWRYRACVLPGGPSRSHFPLPHFLREPFPASAPSAPPLFFSPFSRRILSLFHEGAEFKNICPTFDEVFSAAGPHPLNAFGAAAMATSPPQCLADLAACDGSSFFRWPFFQIVESCGFFLYGLISPLRKGCSPLHSVSGTKTCPFSFWLFCIR